uniref:SKP1 component dimerisation domain-containing protein n=1 Tax=Oryza meridionalis TaxID=40149 RepID=A0A0E0FDU2_9ORYZ
MAMAMEAEAAPAPVPLLLVLRFRNGEDRFALTDQPRQLPLGYAIDAPFIRSARTFGLLDEYGAGPRAARAGRPRRRARHLRLGPRLHGAGGHRHRRAPRPLHVVYNVSLFVEMLQHRHLSNLFHRKAASTLEMDGLSVLCAQKTADVVKERTVEEVKALLGIVVVGMTPEEELLSHPEVLSQA